MKYIFRILYIVVICVLLIALYVLPKQYTDPVEEAPPKTLTKVDFELQEKIRNWEREQNKTFAIAVRELNGQERIANTHIFDKMPTASTYKLFVAYAVLHEVEQGKMSLNKTVSSGKSVEQCLKEMIVVSDNPCGRALGFLVGWENIEKLLESKGITDTYLNNYDENDQLLTAEKTSTPRAHAVFLKLLEKGELLNKSHTDVLLGFMKDQKWRERIPAGVPSDITIADKPGWLPDMQNDAAIVYGPKSTYILVVLSSSNNHASLAEISGIVYEYLQK